jgi:hypothetical protein
MNKAILFLQFCPGNSQAFLISGKNKSKTMLTITEASVILIYNHY